MENESVTNSRILIYSWVCDHKITLGYEVKGKATSYGGGESLRAPEVWESENS